MALERRGSMRARFHGGRMHGTLAAPSSKSHTHRAYLLAAQSTEPCLVTWPLAGGDCDRSLAGLTAMGASWQREGAGIRFTPSILRSPTHLDCGNSGTTLRLLAATASRFPGRFSLDGDASLRRRPSTALWHALTGLGARVESDSPPVTIQGPIRPGRVELAADSSSQFASALLLSLPMLDGPSQLVLHHPIASGPYVDLSLETAAHFGLRYAVKSEANTTRYEVPGHQKPRAASIRIEGDWSGAAFPLAAAALRGEVQIANLRADSKQADRAILDMLKAFGAEVHAGPTIRVSEGALESPQVVDVSACPDLFPVACILAAHARGTTRIQGSRQLRLKESDRIQAMVQGLRSLGIEAREDTNGATITGGTMRGGVVDAQGDHRIHMAFALAGLVSEGPVHVSDAGSVDVSYPGFHNAMATAGLHVDVTP